jgi:TolB-like protein/DNA-binding winged helix-turn-helix (wHTH) protein/Flp pilus assembly protein TadD
MTRLSASAQAVRFGLFELDLTTGELRKQGLRVKLQEQPFQLLAMLLERPRELVTREDIRKKLWPADTFVDFDSSLNSAINKIREALGDSAESPRFIETLPRRGYRFIAPVEEVNGNSIGASLLPAQQGQPQGIRIPNAEQRQTETAGLRYKVAATGVTLAALLVALLGLKVGELRQRFLGKPNPGRIQSIAVLPLENLSGDAQDYFADGMTDALITDLAQIGSLMVISRTSTMQYKGTKKPLPEIARELNVDAVVEGTVVRSGNRVRIDAQLIQAATDRHIWAQGYERDLRDVLALQGEVARAVAVAVRINLTPQQQTHLENTRPVNPEAYEAYLKGSYYWNKRTKAGSDKATEYFEQAIQKDPGYALAYAALAEMFLYSPKFGSVISHNKDATLRARAAAMKALELDPTLGEAHAVLGDIKYHSDWDWTGAEKEFQRAIELSPGSASVCHAYSVYLWATGREDQAFAMIKRTHELDPLEPNIARILAWHLSMAGQHDQAMDVMQAVVEEAPDSFVTHDYLGDIYQRRGMYNEALAEFLKAVDLSGGNAEAQSHLARVYAVSGRRAEAEKILEELKGKSEQANFTFGIATVYAALGRKDEAFDWLEKAYQQHSGEMAAIRGDRNLDPLRSDLRFHDLLQRMHFPDVETRK